MSTGLRRSIKRGVLSWWRVGTTIFAGCSKLHVSIIQHHVNLDGSLLGVDAFKCEWCDEMLPPKLENWTTTL